MKKSKKFLSIFLALIMIVSIIPMSSITASAAETSGTCGENLIWTFDDVTGTLTISGTGEIRGYPYFTTDRTYNRPWEKFKDNIASVVIESGVTSIGYNAFCECTNLTSVTIGNSVTSIGDYAFGFCISLTSVTIPNSVTSIVSNAFYDCRSLTSITIPNSVTSIGEYAFYNTAYYNDTNNWENDVLYIGNHLIKADESISGEYKIKDGTLVIACYALAGCDNLTSVIIPNSVTSIGNNAIYYCTNLTGVTIGDGVTSIGRQAFSYCTSLTDVYYSGTEEEWNNVTIDEYNSPLLNATIHYNDTPTSGYCGENLTWTFDESTGTLTISGTGAMDDYYDEESGELTDRPWESYLNEIETVVIGDGVTTIGNNAFASCESLTEVTIGNSVTTIGMAAFGACIELVTVTIPDSVTTIGMGAFVTCIKLETVTIPDSVTTISDAVFGECIGLTSITIPDSVTTIGNNAFAYCESLTSITIPDSVTTIGDYAFYYCESLMAVTIPGSVTSIGAEAFSHSALMTVIILDGVTTIGENAFSNCSVLTNVTIPNSVSTISDYAFPNCKELTNVFYFGTEEEFTKISIGTSNDDLVNATIHYIDSNDVATGTYGENLTWSYDYQTRTLTVSGTGPMATYSVAPWDQYLFNIDKVVISDGVTSISDQAFERCAVLTSVTIPDSVTAIGRMAFSYCMNLTSVTIPDSVTTIGDGAFRYCNNLTSVTIPDSITTIGAATFMECSSLTSITIPNSVTSIGDFAFFNCESLTDVYYGATEEQWNNVTIGERNEPLLNATIHYNYHPHNYESEVTTAPTCTIDGVKTYTCTICGDSYTERIPATGHTSKIVTVPATCTVAGMEYSVCEICGETLGTPTIIPATGHTTGEWEVVLEPTYETEGKKVKKCTVCGEVVEEEIVPMLEKEVVTDEDTGVSMEFESEDYNGVVDIIVEESFDGTAFDVIDTSLNASQKFIYDISMTVDGIATQPNGAITLRIPLPSGYDPNRSFVYHVDTTTGKVEKMPARYENGYLVFETTHFSFYAVVEEINATISIQNPTTTTIRYKDGIILHANVEGTVPTGAKIVWSASNNKFKTTDSEDGSTLEIVSKSNGYTTFTVKLIDADGKELATDTIEMRSKAGLFDIIGGFFRGLFGLTEIRER